MRGFTMILVVAYHVSQMSFLETEKTSAALSFLVLFRMPLFFFVSGFLAYKAGYVWNAANVLNLAWKKIKIQVLPALVFLCVFLIFCSREPFCQNFLSAMSSPTKYGYWFTWALLVMFLIYYLFEWATKKVSASWIPITLLWLISLVLFQTTFMSRYFSYPSTDFMRYTSLIQVVRFFPYFLLGNIAHRYWGKAERLMDSRWFFPVVCLLAFLCCADYFRWHYLRFEWRNLPRTVSVYCLLMMVVMFFRHYKEQFSSQRRSGQFLQYIGTRTLDIYLLHYLFLSRLPEIGEWLNAHQPVFVLDIVLSVLMALVVIGFCLLVSNILRISPIFRKYLFGR